VLLQGGREYGSDVLLKSGIIENKLWFCVLCLTLRLGEARVSTGRD